jgi:uncharacterized membrane protein
MKEKLLSGRYFLTIISGIVFAYAVWQKLLNAEGTAAIITMVFINYFRQDRPTNGTQNGGGVK